MGFNPYVAVLTAGMRRWLPLSKPKIAAAAFRDEDLFFLQKRLRYVGQHDACEIHNYYQLKYS
jgi:hypothetical protein